MGLCLRAGRSGNPLPGDGKVYPGLDEIGKNSLAERQLNSAAGAKLAPKPDSGARWVAEPGRIAWALLDSEVRMVDSSIEPNSGPKSWNHRGTEIRGERAPVGVPVPRPGNSSGGRCHHPSECFTRSLIASAGPEGGLPSRPGQVVRAVPSDL
jgi:hypothetical protein